MKAGAFSASFDKRNDIRAMNKEQERHIYISVLICLVIFLMLWGSFILYRYATDTLNPAASWFEIWSTPLLVVLAIIYTIRNLRKMRKK